MNFKFFLQKLGKSVLFPIAALPVAGLLIRFGADDMLNIPLLGAAGTIFANMDMLFALSIVIGFSKSKDKAIPAITGFLSLIVLKEGMKIMNPYITRLLNTKTQRHLVDLIYINMLATSLKLLRMV